MFKVSIPEISDEEIIKRYEHIKPVIRKKGKLYYLREFTLSEIKDESYLKNSDENLREEVGKDELVVFKDNDFACLHSYGCCKFFMPSIGEILAQIDGTYIPSLKAFEIIKYPKTESDFYKDSFSYIAFKNGYHVSTVRLYFEKSKILL